MFVEHKPPYIHYGLMFKLIYYNLYRFFSNPKNLSAIFIVLLLNAVMLSAYCSDFSQNDDGLTYTEASSFSDIANRITVFDGNSYTRYTIGTSDAHEEDSEYPISDTVSSANEYRNNVSAMIESANFFLGGDFPADSSIVKYERSVVDIYSSLSDKIAVEGAEFSDTRFFSYNFDILFLIVLLLAYLIPTYTDDSSLDLLGIVRATEKGRATLGTAKIISLLIYIVFTASLFSLSSLLLSGDIHWSAPIQTIPKMALCPYEITILGFYMISLACKIAVLIVTAMVFLPFIVFTYHTAAGAIFAFGICAINVSLSSNDSFSSFSPLNYISLYTLSNPINILGQYKAVEVGDALLPAHIWSVIYLIVLSVLLLPLYILVYTKRPTVLSLRVLYIISEKVHKLPHTDRFINSFKEYFSRRVSHGRDKKFRHMSVSRHEIFKIYSASGIKIILIVLLGVHLILNYPHQSSVTLTERIYKSYITYYQGKVLEDSYMTKHKYEELETSLSKFSKNHADLAYAEESYSAGIITPEKYQEILDEYSTLELREDIFHSFTEYFDYIAGKSETNPVSFVYETGWNAFFTRSPDYILYIAIILLASYIFTIEHESKSSAYQTASIIRAAPYGRADLFARKMKIMLLSVSLFAVLSELISIFSIAVLYTLPHPFAAAASLRIFSAVEADIPLITLAVLSIFMRFSSAVVFALLCCGVSELLEKRLPTMLVSISLIIFPLLIRNMLGSASSFGIDLLISGGNLILAASESVWAVILACITVIITLLAVTAITSAASTKWNNGTTVK